MTLGTFFLRSELGEGSGRKEMQADRSAGLHPGISAGYMWSMGPRQHSLQEVIMISLEMAQRRNPFDWAGLFYMQHAEFAVTCLCYG